MTQRYYQLVMINIRDRELFDRYQREVAPVAFEYGGAERVLLPDQVMGAGVELPDLVNVVYGHSREALDELNADPRFQAVVSMRTDSITMRTVAGQAGRGSVTDDGLAHRLYLVELARFGAGGEEGYRAYEKEAETFMTPYGYHVERVFRPDMADGLPFVPDVVKVAYLDDAGAMDRMHADPGHVRVEGELYEAAVAESLWLVAHPRAPRTLR